VSPAPRAGRVLPRAFYRRPTLDVARDLIGKVLVHRTAEGRSAGVIVEVEAYIGEDDPACHAAPGPTARNAPMYGPPGHAYVYFNYGVHYLVNVVTEPSGVPAAVLVRALEPVEGLDLMRRRRGTRRDGTQVSDHDVCRGPGNLTKAMGIGPGQNRADLTRAARAGRGGAGGSGADAEQSALWIEDRGYRVSAISWSRRIGIQVGVEHEWRCYAEGHPCVSGATAAASAARRTSCRPRRGTRSSGPRGTRRS
jgi:DNA-3-methyladenine glycosylase